jgi:PAS domain S-box-containing protein
MTEGLLDASAEIERLKDRVSTLERELARYRQSEGEPARPEENEILLTPEDVPNFVGLLKPNGEVERVNRQLWEFFGGTEETIRNWGSHPEIHHPEDRARIVAEFAAGVGSGEPFVCTYRGRRYDGVYRWLECEQKPLMDKDGLIYRWCVVMRDIDDLVRATEALRQRENDLRLIINTIPGLICLFTPQGELEGANQQLIDYVGEPVEVIKNWATNGVVHPDDVPSASELFMQAIASGEPYDFEIRIRRFDSAYRYFKIRGRPHRDEQGHIVRWYGLLIDSHDRKLAEDELRRREYNLAMGERVSLTGSYVWEVSTDKITCSEQLLRIHEFDDPATVTAAAMRDRIHPDDLPILESTKAEVEGGRGNPEYEVRLLMPDGRVKFVRAFAEVIQDVDGQFICVGAVQDVSRRRSAEDALDKVRSDLAHLSRITSLGTLTASIAHEVNQPLAGIVTNANTCARMLTADPPNVAGALETVRRTIRDSNRAAEVVSRLRALFSGRTMKAEGLDLNEAAAEVLTLVASDLQRGRVQVQTNFAPDLPRITADRVQLQQVILNLLRNATDAMSNIDDRTRSLVIETRREGDQGVRLSVQDCGVGFPAENAERMFQAFYSTKNSGMGIGLSVSRSIIESHRGQIWAESRDGGGATFAFYIPVEGVRI